MNLFYHLNDRAYGQTSLVTRQRRIEDSDDYQNHDLFRKNCSTFESLIYPNKSIVGRLALSHKLEKHTGCVNTVSWSMCGRYLLSGSDDTHLCIWDWENNGILKASFGTRHTSNIFCAKFMPFTDNSRIITCARDGVINVFDLEQSMKLKERFRQYKCHSDSVKKLVTYSDSPNLFLSCSNDGTVRRFDLRESSKNGTILVKHKKLEINSIDKSGHLFCIGASDPIVRVYDMRNLPEDECTNFDFYTYGSYCPESLREIAQKKPSLFSKGHVTGVAFKSSEILATYNADAIYLFDINNSTKFVKKREEPVEHARDEFDDMPPLERMENLEGETDIYGETEEEREANEIKENETIETIEEKKEQANMEIEKETFVMKYTGHCNIRTVKSVSFFGPNQEYVMSGSDDGNIFIWEKKNAKLINLIKGDKHVVNVLVGHPIDPILATGGIDNSVKVFSPILPHSNPLSNADTVIADNMERLESGPTRPMAIPMALLRRLLQSVHEGGAFGLDLGDEIDDDEPIQVFDNDNSGEDDDNSDDNWVPRDRPDGCPMQ